jgi:hypothetical protein
MKWDIKEKYKKDSECEDPYELFNVYNNYEEF